MCILQASLPWATSCWATARCLPSATSPSPRPGPSPTSPTGTWASASASPSSTHPVPRTPKVTTNDQRNRPQASSRLSSSPFPGRDYQHSLEMQQILKKEIVSIDAFLLLFSGASTRYSETIGARLFLFNLGPV